MPRLIFTVLLFTLLTFLLGRFPRRSWSRRPEGQSTPPNAGDELVQDPNCLTYLPKKQALKSRSNGVTQYFCGSDCMTAFEKKQAKNGF
ncbi:MAG: hypothetical protein WBK96_09220 [Candidatus Manganitrophaceae bacterium]